MRVIFLDVDGVLNSLRTFENVEKVWKETGEIIPELDSEYIQNLKFIVDKTGAFIVLSSSWRHGWNEDIEKCSNHAKQLVSALEEHGLEIWDKTQTEVSPMRREEEIQLWLDQNPYVTSYVIIDDETTELERFLKNGKVVKTNILEDGVMLTDMSEATGLTKEHAIKAINILDPFFGITYDKSALLKYLLFEDPMLKCAVCKHRTILNRYPDCDKDWNCTLENYEISEERFKIEFPDYPFYFKGD